MDRSALESEWLRLTREALPAVAAERAWPIRLDHCFQRVLLDAAFEDVWYGHVTGRPAYAHIEEGALKRAVALGRAVLAGEHDLVRLNHESLAYRGKASPERKVEKARR